MHPATKKTVDLHSLDLTEGNPCRPGYGTRGAKVELTANYVELLPPSDMVLHRYDMYIVPEAAGRKGHWIVQLLLQSAEMAPHQGNLATDFRSTLISNTKFKHDQEEIKIQYRFEGEDESSFGAIVYTVRVHFTKSLSIGDLVNWMNSTSLVDHIQTKKS